MKNHTFFKAVCTDVLRDFSALGNPLLLILFFVLGVPPQFLSKAIAGLLITQAICYLIKAVIHKSRPEKMEYSTLFEKIQAGSFPSVHAASIMFFGLVMISFSTSLFLKILYAALIVIVGYSRHYLKKHFAIDIVCGYALGLGMYIVLF